MKASTAVFADASLGEIFPVLLRGIASLEDRQYLTGLLLYHGAPTLRRVKPAVLTRPPFAARDLLSELPAVGAFLQRRCGVKLACLAESDTSMLLLIYHPGLVERCLGHPEAVRLLEEGGYAHARPLHLAGLIGELAARCGGPAFPHEVGLLLGYPPADVRDFIHGTNRCAGCSAAGWRTARHAETALACHQRCLDAKLRAAKALVANGFAMETSCECLLRGDTA